MIAWWWLLVPSVLSLVGVFVALVTVAGASEASRLDARWEGWQAGYREGQASVVVDRG